MKASGSVERSGMVVFAGLSASEMPQLSAASLDEVPITRVQSGLTRRHDEAPAGILRTAGYDLLTTGSLAVGTTRFLVHGPTIAVVDAGEESHLPARRHATPLLEILDEVVTLCRRRPSPVAPLRLRRRHLHDHPAVLVPGVEVWSLEGMRKLWSATLASVEVRLYGDGISEVGYLDELSG